MKTFAIIFALLCVPTNAFVAHTSHVANTLRVSPAQSTSDLTVRDMPGITDPIGFFDPVGYSETASDEAMLWFRAAELKHSRVAMLAFTGWCVNGAGFHFPGFLSKNEGVSFESLAGLKPIDAWEAVPESGKWQIIFSIFVAEVATEMYKPHYTMAGDKFDPLGYATKWDADKLRAQQNKELNNGRLAMIGMMGFSVAAYMPGAVPALG